MRICRQRGEEHAKRREPCAGDSAFRQAKRQILAEQEGKEQAAERMQRKAGGDGRSRMNVLHAGAKDVIFVLTLVALGVAFVLINRFVPGYSL